MELKIGAIIEGKVKTITNFGAFVDLPENQIGMVHISEVASHYVSDIRQHLSEGQTVKVKVIKIDEKGKIALSMKKAEEPREERKFKSDAPKGNFGASKGSFKPAPKSAPGPMTFEEKLKQFMSDSDSKISGCGLYERRSKTRKR